MLKKRPATAAATTQPSKHESSRRPAASAKRAAPPVEEYDDEEEYDDDEEPTVEEKTPTKAAKKGSSTTAAKSRADAFDSVPASNNADNIPAGKYEAIIRSGILQEPDAKGQSVRFSFELCHPDFGDANQITTWFKLFDADGDRVDGGIRAFKGSMAKLGYEVAFDEIETQLEQITEEVPGIVLKVAYTNDRDGNTWQRATIESTCNNDVVQKYKDNIKY
jgi:hypothetical protein